MAEHTEEAREMDPYGRQPHTPYKPDRTGKNCDHGRNRNLSYYLLVLDKAYTYDAAGKLLTATEAEKGCGTTSCRYTYDAMGNRTLEEKKNPGGKVVGEARRDTPKSRCAVHICRCWRSFVILSLPCQVKSNARCACA